MKKSHSIFREKFDAWEEENKENLKENGLYKINFFTIGHYVQDEHIRIGIVFDEDKNISELIRSEVQQIFDESYGVKYLSNK